jgi:uncharacterized protein
VVPLSRSSSAGGPTWDPASGRLDAGALEGVDAVVHLAGESIAALRWTAAKKRAIHASRVDGTRLLADAITRSPHRPAVFVGASAIGYYGDRSEELLTERSTRGTGFLPDVAVAWEETARPVREVGTRLVHLRFGLVLDPSGGALKPMLVPGRLGLLGRMGSGRQWWAWITRDDAVELVVRALDREDMVGAYNAITPNPARQIDFVRTLARTLGRPALAPAPAFALRAALGEMGDALFLSSARAIPERLSEAGHVFRHPNLEAALGELLSR